MDLDYDGQEEVTKLVLTDSTSTLPVSVKELISLIFDVDTMKSQMVEFEVCFNFIFNSIISLRCKTNLRLFRAVALLSFRFGKSFNFHFPYHRLI